MRIFSSIVILQILLILAITNSAFTQSKGGRWQFENNGNDSAEWDSSDDSGTLMANAYYDNSEPVHEGLYCLNMEDDDSHIKIIDSEDMDFNNENIGISAWIYPSAIEGNVQFLISKGQQNSNPKTTNYALRISKSSKLEFLIRDTHSAQTVASSFIIQPNEWTFIAVYYDYTLKKMYFWNEQTSNPVDTVDYNHDYFGNADPLTIGGWYTSDSENSLYSPFKGKIDDVRISGRLQDILSTAPTHVVSQNYNSNPSMSIKMGIYPNPSSISESNGNVSFAIELNTINNPSISIFNVLGQRVMKRTLSGFDKHQMVQWNRKDRPGNMLPTGTYFVRINNAGQNLTKRLMIIQ